MDFQNRPPPPDNPPHGIPAMTHSLLNLMNAVPNGVQPQDQSIVRSIGVRQVSPKTRTNLDAPITRTIVNPIVSISETPDFTGNLVAPLIPQQREIAPVPVALVEEKPTSIMTYSRKRAKTLAMDALLLPDSESHVWHLEDGSDFVDTYKVPERKKYPRKPVEKKFDTEFANRLLNIPTGDTKGKTGKRNASYGPPPNFNRCERIGRSYISMMDLPTLSRDASWGDWLFQDFLKAHSSDATFSTPIPDEHAPMKAAAARLEYSMIIDEHGIKHLEFEGKLAKAQKNTASLDKLAKQRRKLEASVREYADDKASIYRPPVTVPLEDPEHGLYYSFRFSEMYFLTYASRMIELTSKLMPRHSLVISNALNTYIPLILEAVKHPRLDVHFVGSRNHFTYLYHLFHYFARLDEYFGQISSIPTRASFGLLKKVRADIPCNLNRELQRISQNVTYGGCLSWILCVMRDISMATMLKPATASVVKQATSILADKKDKTGLDDLMKIAYADAKGRRLYLIRFALENNILTFRARLATEQEMDTASHVMLRMPKPVSPFYAILMNLPDVTQEDGETAVCIPDDAEFSVDMDTVVPMGQEEPMLRPTFRPGSRATILSMKN